MEPPELLILYHHDLFADGIAHILREQGLGAVAVDARVPGALAQLETLRPRVVLVEDNDADPVFAGKLGEILQRSGQIGVIRIQAQSNQLGIYTARQVTASRTQDLFDAITHLTEQESRPDQGAPAPLR